MSTISHLEFQESPGTAVEALISINNQLRQPEAAIGVLTVAQQTLNVDLKARVPLFTPVAGDVRAVSLYWCPAIETLLMR